MKKCIEFVSVYRFREQHHGPLWSSFIPVVLFRFHLVTTAYKFS